MKRSTISIIFKSPPSMARRSCIELLPITSLIILFYLFINYLYDNVPLINCKNFYVQINKLLYPNCRAKMPNQKKMNQKPKNNDTFFTLGSNLSSKLKPIWLFWFGFRVSFRVLPWNSKNCVSVCYFRNPWNKFHQFLQINRIVVFIPKGYFMFFCELVLATSLLSRTPE